MLKKITPAYPSIESSIFMLCHTNEVYDKHFISTHICPLKAKPQKNTLVSCKILISLKWIGFPADGLQKEKTMPKMASISVYHLCSQTKGTHFPSSSWWSLVTLKRAPNQCSSYADAQKIPQSHYRNFPAHGPIKSIPKKVSELPTCDGSPVAYPGHEVSRSGRGENVVYAPGSL